MLDSSFSFMGIWSRLNGCQRLYEIYEITRWYNIDRVTMLSS